LGFSSLKIVGFFRKREDARVPFSVQEIDRPDGAVIELFERAFKSPAPTDPRHFVAILRRKDDPRDGRGLGGYIHFIPFDDGVFLCGGLCIDSRLYKTLSRREREAIARQGSLSRWLISNSIAALGRAKAVFAYTGDKRSRTDALAVGFILTEAPFLLVQWHDTLPESSRAALVSRVAAHGPF
jgi:hypothetical protein